MKHVFLVRHAKAGAGDEGTPDFERPLSKRGEREAHEMGARLAARRPRIDRLVSSGAARAIATAHLLGASLGYPADAIQIENRIYEDDAGDLLMRIRGFEAPWERVILVGHNPVITDLANALTDEIIDNVPTCGVLEIAFEGDDWSQVAVGAGRLTHYDFPRHPSD